MYRVKKELRPYYELQLHRMGSLERLTQKALGNYQGQRAEVKRVAHRKYDFSVFETSHFLADKYQGLMTEKCSPLNSESVLSWYVKNIGQAKKLIREEHFIMD